MWGRKSKRIKALEHQHGIDSAAIRRMATTLVDERRQAHALQVRCDSLAADLKRAQNHLLGPLPGLCSACEINVHVDHTPEGGCPDPGCVCLIRDSDPTGGE